MPSKEGRIPTTDEMDKTTPEERNDLVGHCRNCGEMIRFDYRKGVPRCPKCEGLIDSSSIQSFRTYNGVKSRKKTKVNS